MKTVAHTITGSISNTKNSRQRLGARTVSLALGLAASAACSQVQAASQTWTGTTDANWTTTTNWSGSAVPGTNPTGNNTNTTDVATFNSNPANGTTNPIVIDANREIGSILFNTSSAGSFNIGALSGSPTLQFDNGLNITVAPTVVNPQTINAPITVHLPSSTNGTFSIINNASSGAATLTLAGGIVNPTGGGHGTVFTLSGSNTGINNISGPISLSATAGISCSMVKTGSGTWQLSNGNTIVGGVTVNQGLLIATNGGAVGTATATVTTAGTLEINNVGLSAGSIALNSGGTILATGGTSSSATKLAIDTTASSSVTISTGLSTDLFTIGNGTNSLTGGASTSTVKVTGPGTVNLSNASTYVGGWSLNGGTINLGSATALGTAGSPLVAFGSGSNATLNLLGNSVSVAGLSTNATPGTPVIENLSGSGATLTIAGSTTNSFAGTIQDGSGGGSLALVKSGAGTQTLSGSNTFSGGTTINGGLLSVANTSGSGTGSGSVQVNANATLAGTGAISGAVTVATNGVLAPGVGSVGNLSMGSLTLSSGSMLNFNISGSTVQNNAIVTGANGLTINGGQVNLNGGLIPFTTNGVYNLIAYSGSIGGTGVSAMTVNSANENLATNAYSFNTSGGYVTLMVANSGVTIDYWNVDANGAWGTSSNWTAGVPNATGAFAAFGGGGTAITAPRTITVDNAYTVGTISFNNQTNGYTLTNNASGSLTLNNGTSTSFITDAAGTHSIQAPVALTSNGATITVTNAGDTLSMSGVVSGSGTGIVKEGLGTLALSGSNTYFGGTAINVGTVQVNSDAALGDASGGLSFGGGTLQASGNVTSARSISLTSASANMIVDTGANTVNLSGNISPASGAIGGLVKLGSGTLVLGGTNSYTGATNVSAGTLNISSNANLGSPATGAGLTLNNATLVTTATFALDNGGANQRPVTLAGAGGTFNIASGTTLTVDGGLSGSGGITMSGPGQMTILTPTSGSNSLTANTVINQGTILLGDTTAQTNGLGTGSVIFNGSSGTLNLRFTTNTATQNATFTNPIVVNNGSTGTLITTPRGDVSSVVTGNGTLNIQTDYVRSQFDTNFTGFTGLVNVFNNSNGGDMRLNSTSGFPSATLNISSGVTVYDVFNFGSTLTEPIGALEGVGYLTGGPTGGRTLTWSIGGLNTSTGFSGVINNGGGPTAITKVGTGTLLLTGANGYSGLTTVQGGTLEINGEFALGGANYSGLTFNGGTLQLTNPLPLTNGSGDITQNTSGAVPVTLTGAGTFDLNGNSVAFGAALGNSGPGSFTLTDTSATGSSLTLNAASTYTGATTILGGAKLIAGAANVLAPASAFNVNTGTLDVTIGNNSIGSLTMAATSTLNISFGSVLAVTNAASFAGYLNLNGSAGTLPETLITYNSSSGTFPTANVTGIPSGDELYYSSKQLLLAPLGYTQGPATLVWSNASADNTWNTSSLNWNTGTGTVAYSDSSNTSTGDIVTFNDSAGSGGYNVTINNSGGSVHPTSVTFAASGNYNISGVAGAGIAGTGSVTLTGTGTVTMNAVNTYTGGTNVSAGKLVIASATSFPNNGSSGTALTTGAGAVFQIAKHTSGSSYEPIVSTLSNGGLIDITNNEMLFKGASLSTIIGEVSAAYNSANGTWKTTGNGLITSSTVGGLTTVGVASVGSDVLVKATYYGDANLDGQVTTADYTLIDAGFLSNGASTGWQNGDFNYDHVINGSDYTLIDNAFNTQGATLSAQIASPTAQVAGGAASAVPEPASLGLIGIGALGLLGRRNRRRH